MTLRRAIAAGVLIGLASWLVVWFQTDPRANWDSLIYHKHAFEYAGLPAEEADAASWAIYARYGDDGQRAIIIKALDGQERGVDVPAGSRDAEPVAGSAKRPIPVVAAGSRGARWESRSTLELPDEVPGVGT
jgi:hypothetical protein